MYFLIHITRFALNYTPLVWIIQRTEEKFNQEFQRLRDSWLTPHLATHSVLTSLLYSIQFQYFAIMAKSFHSEAAPSVLGHL